jgi:hypothetical protein
LAEIETPLSKLYRTEFSVTPGRRETLSGLAATYLGDALAFAAGPYNTIAQPAMIIAGEQPDPATAGLRGAERLCAARQWPRQTGRRRRLRRIISQRHSASLFAAKPAPPDPGASSTGAGASSVQRRGKT